MVLISALPCSQLSLQQEELEVEEFQLIEKLQQLGINAGISDELSRQLVVHKSCSLLPLKKAKKAIETAAVPGDIKKAKEAGYHTCESLLMNTRKVSMMHVPPRRHHLLASGLVLSQLFVAAVASPQIETMTLAACLAALTTEQD